MVRRAALPLAAFAAGALAQDTTITYSVCPTATTTTVTLSSTITYCPGASCNVSPTLATTTPVITAKPTGGWNNGGNGGWPRPGGYVSTILDWTFTGSDGKVTELHEYATVYPAPCTNGPGMCGATWTITEECPCTAHGGDHIPKDFTTTLHTCDRCGPGGSPTTYTATVPCETGAYAHETPSYGPWKPAKPEGDDSDDDDDADYWAGHGGKGGSGGNGGDGWNGGKGGDADHGAPPKPVADASGAPPAGGNGWNNGGAPGGKPVADAQGSWPSGGAAAAPSGGKPVADAQGSWPSGGHGAAPAGGSPAAAPSGDGGKSPVKPYTGAGSKAAVAVSSVFAVAVGALALML